jgi:hypothetical protein
MLKREVRGNRTMDKDDVPVGLQKSLLLIQMLFKERASPVMNRE